jgi:hypothetical protein
MAVRNRRNENGMVCRIVYMKSAEIAEGTQRLPSGADNLVTWILRKSNRRAFHKGAAELFRELRNGSSV